MGKVIYAINITLDGCCDHTKQFVDEQVLEYFTLLTRESGAQIFGRKTYQLMVPYWPEVLNNPSASKADLEFARAFVSTRKVVFSRSLGSVEDTNTRIVSENLGGEVRKLKQETDKDILADGVDIPAQLLELGLVDEFRVAIGPVVAGEGRRLFDTVSLPEKLRLKLVDCEVFPSGRVVLRYRKM